MEVIHHQEPTLEQVLAQSFGFLLAECPALHLNRVNPGLLEALVGIEGNDLLRWPPVDARQPLHGDQKLPVRFGIVARPRTPPPVAVTTEITRYVCGIGQARPVELRLDVGRGVVISEAEIRSEERRVGKECRSRWS